MKETVVLLHGILNPSLIMAPLARRLKKEGYATFLWAYPGRQKKIEAHANALERFLKTIPGTGPIHFVGYSLGSIIARYLLANRRLPRAGRFVMIGPPNHGCEKAESLYRKHAWFRLIYGTQSIQQLFPHSSFYKTCGVPRVPFGIIAGGTGTRYGFIPWMGEDNDGTVTVSSARLKGAKDFIVLRHAHLPIVWADDTAEHTVRFLKTGAF